MGGVLAQVLTVAYRQSASLTGLLTGAAPAFQRHLGSATACLACSSACCSYAALQDQRACAATVRCHLHAVHHI